MLLPDLNFALGNFLGASELDLMKVEVISGASSAFYGPNAFNGVISMYTKSPFKFQGFSASVKGGERLLNEYSFDTQRPFRIKLEKINSLSRLIFLIYLRMTGKPIIQILLRV